MFLNFVIEVNLLTFHIVNIIRTKDNFALYLFS